MVKFCEQKIVFPICGLCGICFYVNMTFSVFRDCSCINSVRLFTGFCFIYVFFKIDTRSRKAGWS